MSGARRRSASLTEEDQAGSRSGKAQPGGAEPAKRAKLPSLPWTVPVLILIAVVRYRQMGEFDFLSFGAAALVAMRLGSWMSKFLALRRGELDEDELE
jgi:hypothetical protein